MDLFWIIIIYVFVGILLCFVPRCFGKQRIRNFALKVLSGRKWLLDVTMPFVLTMFLSFVFNFVILKVQTPNVVNFLGIPINNGYWMLGANMLFTIPTFFVGLALQRYFIQIVFSQYHIKTMEQITKENFVLQAFILELYRQFTDETKFLSHLNEGKDFQNIDKLIRNLKSDSGVKLSNYLYAVLLKQSLLQEPSCLYSVWDTSIVDIEDDEDYRFYTEYLEEIYTKTKPLTDKIRIFIIDKTIIFKNEEEERKYFAKQIENHKKWKFNEIYYCTDEAFEKIKSNENASEKYDDFILFESGKTKWIIGKDRSDEKTRIDYVDGVIENMKKCFTNHISEYKKISI